MSTSWLLWLMLTLNLRVLLSEILVSLLLDTFPVVGLPDHVVVLIFWKNLHIGVCSGCTIKKKKLIPTVCNSFNFSTSLPTCYLLFFLLVAILIGMRWCLTMVSTCTSPMTHDVKHLFKCLLAICVSSLRNVYADPLLIFKSDLFDFFVVVEL